VLVFDDPAMGLDVVMRRDFLDAMIDLLAESGTTVLLSSHVLTDVERIADRVGILHGGCMLVDATLMRRVTRWTWAPRNGAPPPSGEQVLRAGRRRDGFDLTLLDAGDELLAPLRAQGALGEPAVPTLEELFLDLVGPERPGLLSEPAQALRGPEEVQP
jgi:energy-coupling factor transporter ATP-binding protein EcfA2